MFVSSIVAAQVVDVEERDYFHWVKIIGDDISFT